MVFDKIFGKKKASKKKKNGVKAKKPEKKKSRAAEEIDRDIYAIKAVAIIEILGAPMDYVKKTMENYLEKLGDENDLKINVVHISKPEQKDKFFSIYAEVELFVKKPSRIVDFCFDYMPSSIELLEPEHISFDSHSFSNFFNDLQARLHRLDMTVKNLTAENRLLNQNAHLILRNNILLSLKEKEKDLKTIARNIGIQEEKTKEFLDALVEKGFIIFKSGKYSLNKEKVTFSE